MKYVLLLRAPAEGGPDRYEVAFEARGYVPLSVPVLETVLVHVNALRDKIVCGPNAQGLSGVIVTSKRAVEAWCEAIRSIPPLSRTTQADWRTVPFYVVGDATAAAASEIRTAFPSMAHLAPGENRVCGGADAGTAERLAACILREGCQGQRMLYLTGDKNRDTLPGMLSTGEVALETLEVYHTKGSSTFRDDLGAALERAPWGWVVYFAPSAAAFVAPILCDVFRPDVLKVAVIGPTTASFLRDTLKMRVDVVAPKPTADELCSAVVAFDNIARSNSMSTPLARQEYSAIASTSNSNLAVPPSPRVGRSRSPSITSASDYAERGSPGSPMLCRSPSPSPYLNSLSDKYSLQPNPADWGATALTMGTPEQDDYLHNPDPKRDLKSDQGGTICTARGLANLGCLFVLAAGCLALFIGFPLASHLLSRKQTTQGGFNLGGINATGQLPVIPGNRGLIDIDTPKEAYTKQSYMSSDTLELVFSDEFNTEGRSFYAGDDPYWEAPNLHYWGTNDLEWYDPAAVTTKNGALAITLSKQDPATNHNLTYRSGMVSDISAVAFSSMMIDRVLIACVWTVSDIVGKGWTMGNLGRAGFGASLEGLWPYSYDSCDVGTLPNQTYPGQKMPLAATENGDPAYGGVLSYLQGQRLSACTCPGESHPGPVRKDGSYVGRSAPEIDIFEATVDGGVGKVSQSAQWAPFNAAYQWLNTSDNFAIYDSTVTVLNPYIGGAYQQTTSGLTLTNQDCYELDKACYSVYGFEYVPGFDNAYITWISDDKRVWTVMAGGLGPDPLTEISARPIPQEPMYIIANLGFSVNFGGIDFADIQLPATMMIDYIRVYQPSNAKNIGCDPPEFPTAAYINAYKEAYTNFNLTGWGSPQYNQTVPKNRLNGGC
ncbi:beta-glucan synthesis-associated protein-domain-containing protein [Lanmaoa asiatica]|nr:beta-glucan synthesis-associated protein-domain-containing protein [Lanmaoa asiatica]